MSLSDSLKQGADVLDKAMNVKVDKRTFLQASGVGLTSFLLSLYGCEKKEEPKKAEPELPIKQETNCEPLRKLEVIQEPEDAISQKMIRDWQLAYLGKYDELKTDNEGLTSLGLKPEALVRQNLRMEMEEGFKRLGAHNDYLRLMFAEEGVPIELVDLAFSESHIKDHAGSKVGAMGRYQFVLDTAEENGLTRFNSYIDERCDPISSGRAAAKYLKWSERRFKDSKDSWLWALSAYNQGPGNAKKYYNQTKKKDFSEGMALLDQEHNQLKNEVDNLRGGIQGLQKKLDKLPNVKKNKKARKNLQKQIDKKAGEKKKKFKYMFDIILQRKNYIPKYFGIRRALYGHGQDEGISKTMKCDQIREFDTVEMDYFEEVIDVEVKLGGSLGKIAQENSVTVKDLKKWNDILPKESKVNAGKILKIHKLGTLIKADDVLQYFDDISVISIDENDKKKQLVERFLSANLAFRIRGNDNLDQNQIGEMFLPEGYELRLPAGKGKLFVDKFKEVMQKKEQTVVMEHRAFDVNKIGKLIAERNKETKKKTDADIQFERIMKEIESGSLKDQKAIEALALLPDFYKRELEDGKHTEGYVQGQLSLISAQSSEIQKSLSAEQEIGQNLDNIEEFIKITGEKHEKADKLDADQIFEIADAYIAAYKKIDNGEMKEDCVLKMRAIQKDLENIIKQSIKLIKEGKYQEHKQLIPQELLDNIDKAYEKAEQLAPYTGEEPRVTGVIDFMIETLRAHNQILQEKNIKETKQLQKEKAKEEEKKKDEPKKVDDSRKETQGKVDDVLKGKNKAPKKEEIAKEDMKLRTGLTKKAPKGWKPQDLEICYGVSKEALNKANGWKKTPAKIKPGTMVKIPVKYYEYTVKSGDTVSGIADKYDISMTQICNNNPGLCFTNKKTKKQGMVIHPKEKIIVVSKEKKK